MIAERRIRLCKLLSSGESETIEIKTLQQPLCESWACRGNVLDN